MHRFLGVERENVLVVARTCEGAPIQTQDIIGIPTSPFSTLGTGDCPLFTGPMGHAQLRSRTAKSPQSSQEDRTGDRRSKWPEPHDSMTCRRLGRQSGAPRHHCQRHRVSAVVLRNWDQGLRVGAGGPESCYASYFVLSNFECRAKGRLRAAGLH